LLIPFIQETKWKGQEVKEVEDTGFKRSDGVVEVRRQGDRIILIWMVVRDSALNVINAYAPQVGLSESTKRQLWKDLYSMVSTMPTGKKLFIGKDPHGHVGVTNVGFKRVHEGFGYRSRSQEGADVLNFALAYNLLIANTHFKKTESHLVMFRNGQHSSQIDFILDRREDRHDCLDCKVIPRECVVPQHKLVVQTFIFGYISTKTNVPRLREQSGGKLEGKRRKRLRRGC
jgi:hypothetical protein